MFLSPPHENKTPMPIFLMLVRLAVLVILFLPNQSFALSSDWVHADAVDARLISGIDGVGTETSIPLGLELNLADGWHTYWRSPGEAGLPPQLGFTRSQSDSGNLDSIALHYTAPTRYIAYGLETIGYRDHVVFPLDVTLRKPGQPLNLDLSVDILACSSICVPKHFDLKLTVPAGEPKAGAEAALLQEATDHVPADADKSGLLLSGVSTDGQNLSFAISSRDPLAQPDIFVEDDQNIGFSAPTVSMEVDGHSATLKTHPVDTLPSGKTLIGMPLVLTIVNGDHASEIKVTVPSVSVAPAASTTARAAHPLSLAVAIFFALIGGLILNLMPCVLPVLSLKILGVISHGGGTPHTVRHSFLVTSIGIVFSFVVLASVTVLLKKLGMAMGWGLQFQQPFFVMFLILILTFFAASLWDLFDIPLPRFLADRFDPTYHPKLAGDFATGAFATLLATPCSAPFLGTAIGFALASGTLQIFCIFFALGCGMALPYFAVALFPRLATSLPKPGAWMVRLRHMLGLALALTALWLVWVLAAQITIAYAAVFGLFMTGIMILMALKKYGVKKELILLGIAEFCIVGLILGFNGMLMPKPAAEMDRQWETYDQNALDANIAEGRTVFLDVTADWCLTCKANMKFTLSRDAVAERLFHSDIVAMQANWTNPDPAISDLLKKYGRYGIPFNVVYGPGAPEGITLPELLTPQMVLDALDKASGAPPSPSP